MSLELVCGLGQQYTDYYRVLREDSTPVSRKSLSIRLRNYLGVSHLKDGFLLDLGSGRQILEKEYRGISKIPIPLKVVTLDIADIDKRKLLAPYRMQASHIQGNGVALPFDDKKFSVIVSNMALDFMLPQARDEVRRTLAENGRIFLNLHHPSLYDLIDIYGSREGLNKSAEDTLEFWRFLRKKDVLYRSYNQISESFSTLGFEIIHFKLGTELRDNGNLPKYVNKWWEVDLERQR